MAILQEIKVPLLAVNDSSLTVVDVLFTDGQPVKKGEIVLVFETSKTTYEVLAEADGFIQYYCEAGQDYEVNELVASIFSEASAIVAKEKPVVSAVLQNNIAKTVTVREPALSEVIWEGDTLFSKQALELVASSGIDKSRFAGKDFITLLDVKASLGLLQELPVAAKPLPAAKTKAAAPPLDTTKLIVQKLSSNKKREIDYLADVQSTGLTSTINTIVETEGIFVNVNQSLKFLKNSLLPLIMYETARLLKKYPLLNACYTPEGIALYKEVHVGFAIDIDKGLKVLKLPFTNEQSLGAIEKSIMTLSEKYLDEQLQISDLTDIGFTVTDLSAEGVAFFRPLVNMMNSAILGVSAIDEKLDRCILTVTFDHRVTEGKLVARFLKDLKDRLESYRADAVYKTKQVSCFKCYTSLAEDLSDTGFVKCLQPNGHEGYICQRCLKGF